MKSISRVAVAAALVVTAFVPAAAQELTGAGATFPYPIYSKWFSDYATSTGVKINYQSIGSGGGIKQLSEGTVDFGASDGPMTEEELKTAKGGMEKVGWPKGAKEDERRRRDAGGVAVAGGGPVGWCQILSVSAFLSAKTASSDLSSWSFRQRRNRFRQKAKNGGESYQS